MELFDHIKKTMRNDIPKIGKLGKFDDCHIHKIIECTNLKEIYDKTNDFTETQKECWLWNGIILKKNVGAKGHEHGTMSYKNKTVMVHRLMYHNIIEDVPVYKREAGALQVNHKCTHENNGKCVNPYHMYLGTAKDNTQDSINDGTKAKCESGEKHHNAVLSDEKIKELLTYKNSGLSQKKIAEKFGINQSQVSRYFNKKTRVDNII